ncbi:hypothetical protein, partial [Oceanimonas doudoroffii]|uniref:hypothetical protein n=1 Tax=Oceanimonas doudoroffii TaxID=84158 RepID=UPI001B80E132
ANSETSSMKDLTFVLTARPQPFRPRSENFSKPQYGHVEPGGGSLTEPSGLVQNKQMFPGSFPALQRTASTASNDSWVSAGSAKSSSLEAAAKKVDEMLRLARQKHQENRSRFRDAMDHLDHIYEEIRKEADDAGKKTPQRNTLVGRG